jgi:histidine triad (HIT) family protein
MEDDCPFCRLLRDEETERNRLADIVYADEFTTAFLTPKWWPANPGHVIVIPNEHVENLYGMPDELLGAVYGTARRVAVAMKDAYRCQGTSTRQHNEAAGQQDVWHFHVHVFPRFHGDELYARQHESRWVGPEERRIYADRLKRCLTPEVSDTS